MTGGDWSDRTCECSDVDLAIAPRDCRGSMLVALGTGLLVYNGRSRPMPAPIDTTVASVTGPQAEAAAGPAVQEIKIGPSPALAATADSGATPKASSRGHRPPVIAGEMKPPHEGNRLSTKISAEL